MQLRDIAEGLDQTREIVSKFTGRAESTALSAEAQELIEHLQNALEEVHALYETVCEQANHLASAVAAAHAERERYRYLFEHAPEAYVVSDLHGVIREANPQAAMLLNTPVDFLVGVPLATFVQPDHRPTFRREFIRLGAVERIEEWRVVLQPHNMAPLQASLSVSTVPDPTGRATVLRWLMRDTTKRTSVATLWRVKRHRQHAVCTVAKTEQGLEVVVQSDGTVQIREVFATWDNVLRRASALRGAMKADGWQDGGAIPERNIQSA